MAGTGDYGSYSQEVKAFMDSSGWCAAPVIVLLATAVLFAINGMYSFLSVSDLAGRDLVSNYAYTHLMESNILEGNLTAWNDSWLLGFKSFVVYPPLFFLVTAGFHLLTSVSLVNVFLYIVFGSVFLVPLAAYYMVQQSFSRMEAVSAALYSLAFLFVYPPVSQAYQVLSVGLVAQGFAFLLLLPSIGFLMKDPGEWMCSITGGVLLGLTALAHPFVAVVGFLFAFFNTVRFRTRQSVVAVIVALVLPTIWYAGAMQFLPYLTFVSFETATPGVYLSLLSPLILAGGIYSRRRQTLLFTFVSVLVLSVVELPFVTQEVRFYTYALGVGTILAGMGVYRVSQWVDGRWRTVTGIALLVPVFVLAVQVDTADTWELKDDVSPVYESLDGEPDGRVIVETKNGSIADSFVLQAMLPLETDHWGVNDVHLDASPSARYIVQLEHWISEDPVPNPICEGCQESASPGLMEQRMNDLGIQYAVTRTEDASERVGKELERIYTGSSYSVYRRKNETRIVEKLDHRPVGLVGSYARWKEVNDRLFTSAIDVPVVWLREAENGELFSGMVRMEGKGVDEIIDNLQQVEMDDVEADVSVERGGGVMSIQTER